MNTNNPAAFYVLRHCAAGECEHGCNCRLVHVEVQVDELTEDELVSLATCGTDAQRAEIAAYTAAEAA